MPSRVSHKANTSPVGPAPTIKTSVSFSDGGFAIPISARNFVVFCNRLFCGVVGFSKFPDANFLSILELGNPIFAWIGLLRSSKGNWIMFDSLEFAFLPGDNADHENKIGRKW